MSKRLTSKPRAERRTLTVFSSTLQVCVKKAAPAPPKAEPQLLKVSFRPAEGVKGLAKADAPIVLSLKSENSSLTNRSTREDFPTADSPDEPTRPFGCTDVVDDRWGRGEVGVTWDRYRAGVEWWVGRARAGNGMVEQEQVKQRVFQAAKLGDRGARRADWRPDKAKGG